MSSIDRPSHDAPKILRARKLIRVALGGVRQLHDTSGADDAWRAFGSTLGEMGIRRYLVFLASPGRVGKKRTLALADTYSAGSDWIKAIGADTAALESTSRRLLTALREKGGRIMIPSKEFPLREARHYRELGVQTVFDLPVRTELTRFGAVEIDMENRGQAGSLLEALQALADHLATVLERIKLSASIDEANREAINRGRYIAYEAASATILHNLKHRMRDYTRSLSEQKRRLQDNGDTEALRLIREFEEVIQSWVLAISREFTIHGADRESDPYSAADVVIESVQRHSQSAARRNCHIKLEIYSDAQVVIGQSILKEILSCILINSIEARAQTIRVELAEEDAEDTTLADEALPGARFVTVSVADDGEGVSEEAARRLFELGFTTKSHDGSGIGMTLARLLARQAGGEIELRSRGRVAGEPRTEFVLLIPLVEAG